MTGHDVSARLEKASRDYFFRQREIMTEEDGRVRLWKWDATQKTVVPHLVSVEAAGNELALRYGRQALELNGENPEVQALYLGAVLSDAGYRAGWEAALPTGPGTAFNLAMNAGVPVLSRTVDLSLAAGRVRAAETAMTAALSGGKSESAETQFLTTFSSGSRFEFD